MVDSVALWIEKAPDLLSILENPKHKIDQAGAVVLSGTLGNLRVHQSPAGTRIQGSLPRWYFGQNMSRAGRSTIEKAIGKLEETIGADLRPARVFSIEIGESIMPMKAPPIAYLGCMESLARFKKNTFADGETVLFSTGSRSFQLYDKTAEMTKKDHTIPDLYQGRNVLRLELKYQNRLGQALGQVIHAHDLYDEEIYMGLIDGWKSAYFSIKKCRKIRGEAMEGIANRSQFEKLIIASFIQEHGLDEVLQMIGQTGMEKTQRQRARTAIKDLAQSQALTTTDELIDELDDKVKMACRGYR